MRMISVAPLVGAWIEINNTPFVHLEVTVAPLVGAWIEITLRILKRLLRQSLLSWERGLK